MARWLWYGVGLAAVEVVLMWMFGHWTMLAKLSGMIGIGLLLLSAIFSGALVGGDRGRANFATESQEDRRQRTAVSTRLFLFGLPSVVLMAFTWWTLLAV